MPDDPRLTIPVLLGTIRAGRRSVHVARLLLGRLAGRDEVATALIDLADLDLPVMRHRLGETHAALPGAVELNEKLNRADGLVIVAPEYKNGYPGSLKNAFDYLPAGILRRKPVGIVTALEPVQEQPGDMGTSPACPDGTEEHRDGQPQIVRHRSRPPCIRP